MLGLRPVAFPVSPLATRGVRGRIAVCITVTGLLLWIPANRAQAQPRSGGDAQNDVQSLDRLLPRIRRSHPGKVYDAEGPIYGRSGEPHYHLKWLTPDGGVVWLDADARSGQVLRTSPGHDSFDGH